MTWNLPCVFWRRPWSPVAIILRLLRIKGRISSCSWLNYKANWAPSFTRCQLLKWEYRLGLIWPPHAKSWLIRKDSDAGRDWGQEEKGTTGGDGWMASLTRWTWVWVSSGSWWWTRRPGVLRFMGSQRVGHDWLTELNWGGAFKLEWENRRKSWWNWGHWAHKFWYTSFASDVSIGSKVKVGFLPPSQKINSVLLEEIVISSETVAMQDDVDSPQDSPSQPLFAFRLITRCKSQQAPKGEVQSVTLEEVHYTLKRTAWVFSFMYTKIQGMCRGKDI